MYNEDYVSFETAKLLKEKGFDWVESPFYSEQDRNEWRQNNSYTVPNEEYNPELPFDSETLTLVVPHVSLQMAMRWLREVHNIFIQVELYSKYDNYCFELFQNTHRLIIEHREVYNSYEESCEAAIKYCLENLI